MHIELRRWADVLVIAPLSANTLAKISNGICDNLLTCVVRAWEVHDQNGDIEQKLIYVAPAMNTAMWHHPVTAKHLEDMGADRTLHWIRPIMPISKELACKDVGDGAMAEWSSILEMIEGCIHYWEMSRGAMRRDHRPEAESSRFARDQQSNDWAVSCFRRTSGSISCNSQDWASDVHGSKARLTIWLLGYSLAADADDNSPTSRLRVVTQGPHRIVQALSILQNGSGGSDEAVRVSDSTRAERISRSDFSNHESKPQTVDRWSDERNLQPVPTLITLAPTSPRSFSHSLQTPRRHHRHPLRCGPFSPAALVLVRRRTPDPPQLQPHHSRSFRSAPSLPLSAAALSKRAKLCAQLAYLDYSALRAKRQYLIPSASLLRLIATTFATNSTLNLPIRPIQSLAHTSTPLRISSLTSGRCRAKPHDAQPLEYIMAPEDRIRLHIPQRLLYEEPLSQRRSYC
ncbi:hypothetical protein MRB53_038607 [Persea americana]|nr:hypothetical protein MRB53_038607 [Persea americana]